MRAWANICLFNYVQLLFLFNCIIQRVSCHNMGRVQPEENYFKDFKMPNVSPSKDDDYLCTGLALNTSVEEWVVRYIPLASANIAHHMILIGCSGISKNNLESKFWDCGNHKVCDGVKPMFAWGKNAPAINLPNDVGFRIGGNSSIKFLTLQVHYTKVLPEGVIDESGLRMEITRKPQKYKAGILVLSSRFLDIPPLTLKTHADINCEIGVTEPNGINVFGFWSHAHKLGTVITGYKYEPKINKITEIVKGNPQWPQAFYPLGSVLNVKPKDVLHARCTYNSSSKSIHTYLGLTSNDEMCDLFLMYYTDRDIKSEYGCAGESFPELTAQLPASSDEPLPHNSILERMTLGENKDKDKEISFSEEFSSNNKNFQRNFDAEKALEALTSRGDIPFGSWSLICVLSVVLGLIIVLSTLTVIMRYRKKGKGSHIRYLETNKLLNTFNGKRKVTAIDIEADELDSDDSNKE